MVGFNQLKVDDSKTAVERQTAHERFAKSELAVFDTTADTGTRRIALDNINRAVDKYPEFSDATLVKKLLQVASSDSDKFFRSDAAQSVFETVAGRPDLADRPLINDLVKLATAPQAGEHMSVDVSARNTLGIVLAKERPDLGGAIAEGLNTAANSPDPSVRLGAQKTFASILDNGAANTFDLTTARGIVKASKLDPNHEVRDKAIENVVALKSLRPDLAPAINQYEHSLNPTQPASKGSSGAAAP